MARKTKCLLVMLLILTMLPIHSLTVQNIEAVAADATDLVDVEIAFKAEDMDALDLTGYTPLTHENNYWISHDIWHFGHSSTVIDSETLLGQEQWYLESPIFGGGRHYTYNLEIDKNDSNNAYRINAAVENKLSMPIRYPQSVKDAIAEGKEVLVVLTNPDPTELGYEYFLQDATVDGTLESKNISTEQLELEFKPYLKFAGTEYSFREKFRANVIDASGNKVADGPLEHDIGMGQAPYSWTLFAMFPNQRRVMSQSDGLGAGVMESTTNEIEPIGKFRMQDIKVDVHFYTTRAYGDTTGIGPADVGSGVGFLTNSGNVLVSGDPFPTSSVQISANTNNYSSHGLREGGATGMTFRFHVRADFYVKDTSTKRLVEVHRNRTGGYISHVETQISQLSLSDNTYTISNKGSYVVNNRFVSTDNMDVDSSTTWEEITGADPQTQIGTGPATVTLTEGEDETIYVEYIRDIVTPVPPNVPLNGDISLTQKRISRYYSISGLDNADIVTWQRARTSRTWPYSRDCCICSFGGGGKCECEPCQCTHGFAEWIDGYYQVHFVNNASMDPRVVVAPWTDSSGTYNPFGLRYRYNKANEDMSGTSTHHLPYYTAFSLL